MKILDFFKNLGTGLYNSIKRFPLTIVFTAAIAVIAMVMVHNEGNFTRNTMDLLARVCMTLGLAALLTLCLKVKCERFELCDSSTIWALNLAMVGFSYLYFSYFLPDLNMTSVTRYVAVMFALVLAFFFIPYIKNKNIFEVYVIKIAVRALITALYSGVLFLGIAAILFTLDKLLGISIDGKVYFDVWLGIVGAFAPCFFLAGLPLYSEELHMSEYPKPIKILLLYIVMPLISIYTTILYIYFIKILVFATWPVGLVAHLVLWYSFVSIAVLFLITPFEEESKWVQTFRFWFIKLVIPLLAMMFVSLWIRISEYGITENRYYVAIAGLWILGIMIYMNLKKVRKNIVIPISLAIVAVLSVFGPWSSFSTSIMSQNARLEGILSANNMLKDGKVIKTAAAVTDKDQKEISQILFYFSSSHSFSDVRCLPQGFTMDKMEDTFGVTPRSSYDPKNRYFSYYSDGLWEAATITDYDYFLTNETTKVISNTPYLKYDFSTLEFRIYSGDKAIYEKNFSKYAENLYNQYDEKLGEKAHGSPLIFEDQSQNAKVKILLKNVGGNKDENGKLNIYNAEFYVLVKILNP